MAGSYEEMKAWMKIMHEATVVKKTATPAATPRPSESAGRDSRESKESKESKEPSESREFNSELLTDLTPKRRLSDGAVHAFFSFVFIQFPHTFFLANNSAMDPNLRRFLDILSYVDEDELKPYFEMAKKDVESAIGAYYASKMTK